MIDKKYIFFYKQFGDKRDTKRGVLTVFMDFWYRPSETRKNKTQVVWRPIGDPPIS